MTLAIEKVLPDPVTPSRVWWGRPASSPSTNWRMASGWSPVGWNSLCSLNEDMAPSVDTKKGGSAPFCFLFSRLGDESYSATTSKVTSAVTSLWSFTLAV